MRHLDFYKRLVVVVGGIWRSKQSIQIMQWSKYILRLAVAVLLATGSLQAGTFTWTGSTSTDWFTPSNWSPNGNPGASDTVNFSSGTINFTSAASFGGVFNWSGGTMTGNPLTLSSGGTMNITGSVTLQNVLTNSGTVTQSGSGLFTIYNNNSNYKGAVYNLAGGVWDLQNNSGVSCACFGGEVFNNAGLFKKSAGSSTSTVSLTFNNTGTVTLSTGALSFQSGGLIHGTYNASAGTTLNFNAGAFSYSVAPTLNGPGAFNFSGGSLTLLDDVIPNLSYTGGTLSLSAGFQSGAITNLTLNGSTLSGSNAVSGLLTWNSGTMTGSLLVLSNGLVNWGAGISFGSVTVASNAVVAFSGSATIQNTFTNYGTVTESGSGNVTIYNNLSNYKGGIFNTVGALWDIQNNQGIGCACFGGEFINNAGLLRKSQGTGASSLGAAITNSGTISGLQGAFNLQSGGLVNGTFNAGAGASISFNGGNFVYTTVPTITGAGTVQFSNGNLTLVDDAVPSLKMTGGTLLLGPVFQGGSITNLTLSGSALAGSNAVSGTFNAVSGNILGALTILSGATLNSGSPTYIGPVNIASGANLNITNSTTLQNLLTNAGTMTVSGSGSLTIYNNNSNYKGGVFNLAGAVFDLQNNQNIGCACYGFEFINNAGTFKRSAGSSAIFISPTLTNSATVTVQQGTVNFNNGGLINGTFNASAGTVINFNAGTFTYTTPPVLNGPGLIQLNGSATLTLQTDIIPNLGLAGGNVNLAPGFQGGAITNLTISGGTLNGTNTVSGTFNWSGGTVLGGLLVQSNATVNWGGGTLAGPMNIQTNGQLKITGSVVIQSPLTNSGIVTVSGGGAVTLYNNASNYRGLINNLANGLWDIQNNQNLSCACYTFEQILNAGVFQKSVGVGSMTISVSFTNTGTISGLSGTLGFSGGGSVGGAYTTAAGGIVSFTGGTFNMGVAPTVSGAGITKFDGGILNAFQDIPSGFQLTGGTVFLGPAFQSSGSITNLALNGSTLSGTNTVVGTFNWQNGIIAGPITIANSALLNLTSSSGVVLQHVLTNFGTVTWTGSGALSIYNNNTSYRGFIYNQPSGVFDLQGNQTINCACYGFEGYVNNGTFKKSSGSGTAFVSVPFTNTASVIVSSGTLSFNSGGSIAGTYNAAAGATVNFASGNFFMGNPPAIAGLGVTRFNGGILTLTQDIPGNLQLTGGAVFLSPNFQSGSITNFTLSGSTLTSTNTVTGTLNVLGSTISGVLTVASNAVVNLNGNNAMILQNVLTNSGTVSMNGTGGISIYNNNSTYRGGIYNLAGGLWQIQTNCVINCACYGFEFFNSAGTVQKLGSSGTATISVPFVSSGVVDVQTGILSFTASPAYSQTGGTMNFGLYGTNVAGRLNTVGNLALDGTLSVNLANGYVPGLSNIFTLVGYGSRSGTFQNLSLPPAGPGLGWQVVYGSSALTLQVISNSASAFGISGAVVTPFQSASTNLLLNGGADSGTLASWTVGGPATAFVDNGTFDGSVFPHSGSYDFAGGSGGTSGATGSLSQIVDITSVPGFTVTQIDAGGLQAEVSFWEQGLNQGASSDQAYVSLTFLDATAQALGTVSTPNIDSHNGVWQNQVQLFAVPSGTRQLKYSMQFVRNNGTDLDAFIDDNVLAIADTSGHPVTNVVVFAYTTNTPSVYYSAVTDTNGNFSLKLPNGTYYVGVLGLPALGNNPVPVQIVTINNGNQSVNFSTQPFSGQHFNITTSVNLAAGGTATGGGSVTGGSTVTVKATPNTNTLPYIFVSWTENNVFQSANPTYSFTAVRDRQLTANFSLPSYLISVANSPLAGGTVLGGGSYLYLSTNVLTAYPNFGYNFTSWTEGGVVVGTNPVLSSVVYSNRSFVANYSEANTSHLITTATQPPGLATVSGAGTYTNTQIANFVAPQKITNATFIYTFQQFMLSNSVITYNPSFQKTFSTLDATNLQYVAVYTAQAIAPQVAAASANFANPVPGTTNFVVTVRFDRSMNTNFYPTLSLTNGVLASLLSIPTNGGAWSTYSSANDQYVAPAVTIGIGLNGTNLLQVSGAKDINGGVLVATNPVSFVVQATPPPSPLLSLTASNSTSATLSWSGYVAPSDLSVFRIFFQTTNFGSLASLTPSTALGSAARAYTVGGLTLDTPYYVEVQAVDTAGNSSLFTSPFTFVLPSSIPPPVTVLQSPVGSSTASLSWNTYNPSSLLGFAGFRVYHATTNFSSVVGMTPDTTLSASTFGYQETGLDRAQTYYFAVVGFNGTNGFNPAVTTVSWSDPFAGNISANTTLGGAGQVVNIYQSIQVVSNATLTIAPGTTLLFAPGTMLSVQQGKVIANGTALSPIILDSVNDVAGGTPAAGDWGGVNLGANAGASILNFVDIRYGGGLVLDGCAPTVTAFSARNNSPVGLALMNSAALNTSSALITGNDLGVVQFDNSILTLGNSVIKNNGTNAYGAGGTSMFATMNWWGSAAQADVQASLLGNVSYQPFLNYEPILTPAIGASNGVTQIGTSSVNLLLASRTADSMRISEDNTFNGVFFSPFTNAINFPLSLGGGFKHIFAQFRSVTGQTNTPLELDVNYVNGGPVIQSFSLVENQLLNRPLTVTGSATAVLGMQDVEFYLDGVLQGTNAGGSFSQFFDIRTLNNAVHQVELLARDNFGNIATLQNNVVISVNPPVAPTLQSPSADYVTNNAGLTIVGTAEPNLSIQITDNGQILALLTSDASGHFGVTNATLAEDGNTILAIASDITGTTPSAARHVTVQTTPPAQLVMNLPVYSPVSGLNASWHYPATGKQASSFRVYWSTSSFATTNQATGHSILLPVMNYNLQAIPDGNYYIGVVGYDSAGNPSPLSALVTGTYDATPPVMSISYSHPSPQGVGPLTVILTASETLGAVPTLTFKPAGAYSPILASLTNVALNTYQTVFNVTASTPSGTVNVQCGALDQAGNSFNGAPNGAALVIDTTAPTAAISTIPATPVPTTVPTNVSVNVVLSKNAGAGTTPTLTYLPPFGTNVPVQLAGSGSNWNGTLPVNSGMSNGIGSFVFSAQDSVGNVGTNILSGAQLELYSTALPAPPAVPKGFVASSLPGGQISLSWNSVSNAQIYRLYRQAGTNFTLPGTVYLDNISSNHVVDLPPGDGQYNYGLSASRLGSDSAITNVVATSDGTAPPAPINTLVALAPSGVQITWQKAPGETPASYKIYRNGILVQSTPSVTPIVDYPPKGTNTYVVSSVDAVGNEAPGASASINLLVSPVNNVLVVVNYGLAPAVSWGSTDPSVVGFNFYRNGVKQNGSLIPGTNYTDNLPVNDAVQYAVTAVNALAQESPQRLVTVYPVGMGLQINPLGATQNNTPYVNYFDKFIAGITNQSAGSTLPVARIQYNRTIVGLDPYSVTQIFTTNISAGGNLQQTVIFPESTAPAAESMQIVVDQQTDSQGSRVVYQDTFGLPSAQLPPTEIAVSVNQLPLAGGLTPFQVQVFNRGYADMAFIVSRGSGGLPGDLYVSVQNSQGQELGRTTFQGTPPGTTFLADGRAYVKINAGASLSFTVPNVLSPAALAGATNVIFAVGISNIYYSFNHVDQLVSGPLQGSMLSSSLAQAPYYATSHTDKSNYSNDDPVVISGQALDTATGLPVPNVPVNIGFSTRGFKWYHAVNTDGAGNFQYTLNPPSGFAGTLSIWGAHPLVVDKLNQNQIFIYRVYANPSGGNIQMSKNDTFKFTIGLINPGDTALTGISTVVNAFTLSGTNQTPVGTVTGTNLAGSTFSIGAGQTQHVTLQLSAAINAPDSLETDFTFTSAEGASTTFSASLNLLPAVPLLSVVSPNVGYLQVSVNRGDQRSGQVTVVNNGLRDLLGVTLQQPTNQTWIAATLPVSPDGKIHLPDLAVGQSNTFTVVFTPPTNTTLGFYSDGIVIQGTNSATPFTVGIYGLVTSSLRGGVQFFVDDILGSAVPNAAVRMHNSALQVDPAPFYTDTNGLVTITNLQEGSWDWQVSAQGCSPTVGQIDITAEQVGYKHTRLSRSLVTVTFSVVPVPFTDTYEIHVDQTFQTHVPAGVLVVTPPFMSFSNLVDGFQAEFTASVQNYGLIQMTDCVIKGNQANGLQLTPLITYIPLLLPMQSVDVPFVLTYTANGNGPMGIQGRQVGVGDCIGGAIPGGGFGSDQMLGVAAVLSAAMKCYGDGAAQNGLASLAVLAAASIVASTLTSPLEFAANAIGSLVGCLIGLFIDDLPGGIPSDTPGTNPINVSKGPECFTADTSILLADGSSRLISLIQTNDVVRTGVDKGSVARVASIRSISATNLYDVRFGADKSILHVTGDHRLWVDGKGWVAVNRLSAGDWLLDSQGKRSLIHSCVAAHEPAQVYTLQLSGDEAFYANGILVHDGCGSPPVRSPLAMKGGSR